MTMKATIEGLRALMYLNAAAIDRSRHHPDPAVRQRQDELVGLLTPVCKAFGTDSGVELANLAIQIHGGMGYVEETGVAQHLRDSRIAPIYEGTNGIQAADLVARKLPVRGGQSVLELLGEMRATGEELAAHDELAVIRQNLATQVDHLEVATRSVLAAGGCQPHRRPGRLLALPAHVRPGGLRLAAGPLRPQAQRLLDGDGGGFDHEFLRAKVVTARFYATQLLPQAGGLLGAVTAGPGDLYAIEPKYLAG